LKEAVLGKICDINPRLEKNLRLDLVCSFIPMDYVDEISGTIRDRSVRPVSEVAKGYTAFIEGDVLFAKITPCMENGKCTIAKNLINGRGFGSTEFHVIRPTESITSNWIFYFLRQTKIRQDAERNMTGSAGQKRVPTQYISELKIPLPSFEEQERIARILAKCDRIRRTRRYTQQLSDTYLQSVFLEMFGGESARDWDSIKVESIVKKIRTGPFGSQLLHSEFIDNGAVSVLGIDNAVENSFSWKKRRFISLDKYQELKRYTVHSGDVLITIMGTCGKCAIVPKDIPLAINTKHLCCLTLDEKKCLPEYLQSFFLLHPLALRQLGLSERGAVMPGLNMGLIKDLTMPLPPISVQEKFAQIVQKYDRLCTQQREATRQAEHLFQTTLHRAFQGEL
jgi:type I restriction enzyme, S subunit